MFHPVHGLPPLHQVHERGVELVFINFSGLGDPDDDFTVAQGRHDRPDVPVPGGAGGFRPGEHTGADLQVGGNGDLKLVLLDPELFW